MSAFPHHRLRQFLCRWLPVVLLLSGCVRYVDVKDNWPWVDEFFLPSTKNMVVTRAEASSPDSSLCVSRARLAVTDQLGGILSGELGRLDEIFSADTTLRALLEQTADAVEVAEILAMQEIYFFPPKLRQEGGRWHCSESGGIDIAKIFMLVARQLGNHPAVLGQLEKSELFREVKAKELQKDEVRTAP